MTDILLDGAWINRLSDYNVLYVGLSGGLDSTVLLHRLAIDPTLFEKIHAVHINHGLSAHALEWEQHCERLCTALLIPLSIHHVKLSSTTNIEENARLARYAVFHSLLTKADALLLAHHEDDQAETLLLNLMRGTGIDGLAAMEDAQSLDQGELLRPLLRYSRKTLESYAGQYGLSWVNDESNHDERFSRNFIRHRVMPLLREKWPKAGQTIARASRHCQDASKQLDALAKMDCVELTTRTHCLSVISIKSLPRSRVLNCLRVWLKQNGHLRPSEKTLNRLIDEVVLARVDAVPMVSFGDVVVRRYQQYLYCLKVTACPVVFASVAQQSSGVSDNPFKTTGSLSYARKDGGGGQLRLKKDRVVTKNVQSVTRTVVWSNFPEPLRLGFPIGMLSVEMTAVPLPSQVEVRFRTGGERFRFHGQTKTLKHLFQEWQIPPWERDNVPLLYIDDELAVVIGYAVSDYFYNVISIVRESCHNL